MSRQLTNEVLLPGSRHRATHQSSVDAILRPLGIKIPVYSIGKQFMNRNNWTYRQFAGKFCELVKTKNITSITENDIKDIIKTFERIRHPAIIIAETPEKLPYSTMTALMGGAYHEALHTKHTYMKDLIPQHVLDVVAPRLGKADWGNLMVPLLNWMNLIEDIRIERLGCVDYVGILSRMESLQDFILDMEEESRLKAQEEAKKKDEEYEESPANIVCCIFRDLGLGYQTDRGQAVIEWYQNNFSELFQFVANGPLTPFLEKAKNLTNEDDETCFELAMDVLICLTEHSKPSDSDGQGDCEAPGKEGDKKKNKDGSKKDTDGKFGDLTDAHMGMKGKKPKDRGDLSGNPQKKEGEEKEGEEGTPPEKDFEGYDEDKDQLTKDTSEGAGTGKEGSSMAVPFSLGGTKGGNHGGKWGQNISTEQAQQIAQSLLQTNTYLDSMGALNDYFDNLAQKENAHAERLNKEDARKEKFAKKNPYQTQENVYRPFSTAFDKTEKISQRGDVSILYSEVKGVTNHLRARLRTLFRAQEMVDIEHGVKRGKSLSERTMVESFVELTHNQFPNRAFYDESEAPDLSVAASVVIDESSSMLDKLKDSKKVLLSLTDALDSIGAKTQVFGFMMGGNEAYQHVGTSGNPYEEFKGYHRSHSMLYHVYKDFDERFLTIKNRFDGVLASGGTPMADGVHTAIYNLSERNEGHRFVFVVTDGDPDQNQAGPLKHQLRLAAEAGIKVIAIGLGRGSEFVQYTFPDGHVYAQDLAEIPAKLIQKITELLDKTERNRYKRLTKEG